MEKVFEGLKVVELASVLAGPAVGMFFAELGAEVIKVENPIQGGDVTRSWKLPNENPEAKVSAYWAAVNYKKDHLFLNLKNETDLKTVRQLIADADILLTNFKKGTDKKLGIEYEKMKTINPKLIQCHLKGFDSDENRTAYDVVLQAETGYMSMNGTPESGPVKIPLAIMDLFAAHQMKQAILIALWKREKSGEGSYIEASLEKCAIGNLANQASNYLMANHIPQGMGSLHPNIAPYGETYTCADGKQIVLAVGNDKHFQLLCEILGKSELAFDEKFNNNYNRVINRIEMSDILAPLFRAFSREDLMNKIIALKIPAGAILNMKEVFENPIAQEMIREEDVDGVLTRRVSSIGFEIY